MGGLKGDMNEAVLQEKLFIADPKLAFQHGGGSSVLPSIFQITAGIINYRGSFQSFFLTEF